MEKKVIGLSISIMLIILAFSGCSENDNNKPAEDPLLIQISNNFINFFNNVTSYKFNKTGGIRVKDINGEAVDESVFVSNTTFQADISKRSLEIISNYTNVGMNLNSSLIIYIKDNYKYSGELENGNLSWEIDELSNQSAETNWIIYSNLDQYADQMINEISQKNFEVTWRHLDDETLDNETFYVLQREHIMNNTDKEHPGSDIYKLYHTFLFNKTNYKLYKVKVDILNDIWGEYYTRGPDRRYVVGQDIFTFYDYNVPVDIELPPELTK